MKLGRKKRNAEKEQIQKIVAEKASDAEYYKRRKGKKNEMKIGRELCIHNGNKIRKMHTKTEKCKKNAGSRNQKKSKKN